MVLHRVFQGDHVHGVVTQLADHGGHGGALAASRRAHDQDHAVVCADQTLVAVQIGSVQANALGVQQAFVPIQQTNGHAFSKGSGKGVHAQVHVLALDAHVGPAVLGNAALGRVHAAHDLQASDDACLQLLGDLQDGAKHAVNAHAHVQIVLPWLQVHVAGALRDGPLYDAVDQAHRGRGRGILHVRCRRDPGLGLGLTGIPPHLLDGSGGAFVAVQGHDGPLDGVLGGHQGNNPLARSSAHRFDGHEVQRVGHGQVHFVRGDGHRDHVVLAGHVLADHPAHLRVKVALGKVHELNAQLHLQRLDQALLGDDPLGNEFVSQTTLGLLLSFQRIRQLPVGDQPRIYEHVSQTLVCHALPFPGRTQPAPQTTVGTMVPTNRKGKQALTGFRSRTVTKPRARGCFG